MVNGTAMVTGVYPGKSGVIANYVYRPDIEAHVAIAVESPVVVKKGDQLSNGKYISVPTIAELVQRAGGRTAVASAKTVGLLLDRRVGIGPAKNCTTLFAGSALPDGVLARIAAALGPFPSARLQRARWSAKTWRHHAGWERRQRSFLCCRTRRDGDAPPRRIFAAIGFCGSDFYQTGFVRNLPPE